MSFIPGLGSIPTHAGSRVSNYINVNSAGQQNQDGQTDSFQSTLRDVTGQETKESFKKGLPRIAAISLQGVESVHQNPASNQLQDYITRLKEKVLQLGRIHGIAELVPLDDIPYIKRKKRDLRGSTKDFLQSAYTLFEIARKVESSTDSQQEESLGLYTDILDNYEDILIEVDRGRELNQMLQSLGLGHLSSTGNLNLFATNLQASFTNNLISILNFSDDDDEDGGGSDSNPFASSVGNNNQNNPFGFLNPAQQAEVNQSLQDNT